MEIDYNYIFLISKLNQISHCHLETQNPYTPYRVARTTWKNNFK